MIAVEGGGFKEHSRPCSQQQVGMSLYQIFYQVKRKIKWNKTTFKPPQSENVFRK